MNAAGPLLSIDVLVDGAVPWKSGARRPDHNPSGYPMYPFQTWPVALVRPTASCYLE